MVEKISADIREVLQAAEMRDRMAQVSAEIVASTPSDFQLFIKAEADHWGKVIRDLNIKKE